MYLSTVCNRSWRRRDMLRAHQHSGKDRLARLLKAAEITEIRQHQSLLVLQLQGQWNSAVQPVWCALVDSSDIVLSSVWLPRIGLHRMPDGANKNKSRATSSTDTSKLPRCRRAMKCSAPHRSYSIIARDCSKGAKPRRTGGPLKKCRCLLLPNFLSCFRFWNLRVSCRASQVIKSSVAYRSWAPISGRFQHLPAR